MNGDVITSYLIKILGVMALILLNGIFVAAEFAFVKLRDAQLEPLIAKGQRSAKVARHIVENVTSYLSATQIGITMCSLGLGWFGEPVFTSLLQPVLVWLDVSNPALQHSISFAIGFTVITFLQIVLAELGPKWVAIQKTLPTALWLAIPLSWFYKAFYPFNWALNSTAIWLMKRIGIEAADESESSHSRDELRVMLTHDRSGSIMLGRNIILNALDLGHRTVREVMRPRKEISFFSTDQSGAECLDLAEKTRYSRFPLCERGNLDKILGIVHLKDIYPMQSRLHSGADLIPVARKILYIPETARLEKVLKLLLDRKLHFAIVVDEYGGTVGMATLENILEELVGQIQDEFDQEKPLLNPCGPMCWEVDGALPLHGLAEVTEQELSSEGIATTSGWVTQQLGGFPKAGDKLKLGAFELRVEEMDGLRVARLKLQRLPEVKPKK